MTDPLRTEKRLGSLVIVNLFSDCADIPRPLLLSRHYGFPSAGMVLRNIRPHLMNMVEWIQLSVTNPSITCNCDGSLLGAHLPLPFYCLLITSQRRGDIWQNRNINDHRVTGHKRNDIIVKVPN